jgi:hypothetical protein
MFFRVNAIISTQTMVVKTLKRQMNEQLILDLFLKVICSSNAYIGKLLYFTQRDGS